MHTNSLLLNKNKLTVPMPFLSTYSLRVRFHYHTCEYDFYHG